MRTRIRFNMRLPVTQPPGTSAAATAAMLQARFEPEGAGTESLVALVPSPERPSTDVPGRRTPLSSTLPTLQVPDTARPQTTSIATRVSPAAAGAGAVAAPAGAADLRPGTAADLRPVDITPHPPPTPRGDQRRQMQLQGQQAGMLKRHEHLLRKQMALLERAQRSSMLDAASGERWQMHSLLSRERERSMHATWGAVQTKSAKPDTLFSPRRADVWTWAKPELARPADELRPTTASAAAAGGAFGRATSTRLVKQAPPPSRPAASARSAAEAARHREPWGDVPRQHVMRIMTATAMSLEGDNDALREEMETQTSLHEAVVSELHGLLAEARSQRDQATDELLGTSNRLAAETKARQTIGMHLATARARAAAHDALWLHETTASDAHLSQLGSELQTTHLRVFELEKALKVAQAAHAGLSASAQASQARLGMEVAVLSDELRQQERVTARIATDQRRKWDMEAARYSVVLATRDEALRMARAELESLKAKLWEQGAEARAYRHLLCEELESAEEGYAELHVALNTEKRKNRSSSLAQRMALAGKDGVARSKSAKDAASKGSTEGELQELREVIAELQERLQAAEEAALAAKKASERRLMDARRQSEAQLAEQRQAYDARLKEMEERLGGANEEQDKELERLRKQVARLQDLNRTKEEEKAALRKEVDDLKYENGALKAKFAKIF